ncbi:hypothetical protein PG999_008503 [Apiospora kogelbergensis]|uniref:C2H2-type domain-containing protein n=1 Tax=Apiospora kogelbergensis TaxID=1337665 RepID=A0AAW0QI33_9PEZI
MNFVMPYPSWPTVRSQVAAPRRLLPAPTAVNNHPVRSQVAAPRRLLPAPTRNIPAIQGQAAGCSVARASTTNPPVPSSNIDPALTASSANFMCKNCGGRFATAANLRSHRWQVYGELVSPTRSGFVQPRTDETSHLALSWVLLELIPLMAVLAANSDIMLVSHQQVKQTNSTLVSLSITKSLTNYGDSYLDALEANLSIAEKGSSAFSADHFGISPLIEQE